MMTITEEQSVVIKLRKYMVRLGGMGNSWGVLWWLFLRVMCVVLMLYDFYVIVINDGVYMVDKINVLCWGLLLMLMKT